MIVIGHFSTLRGAGHKLYTRLLTATTALRELWRSVLWRLGWRAVAIGISGNPAACTADLRCTRANTDIFAALRFHDEVPGCLLDTGHHPALFYGYGAVAGRRTGHLAGGPRIPGENGGSRLGKRDVCPARALCRDDAAVPAARRIAHPSGRDGAGG